MKKTEKYLLFFEIGGILFVMLCSFFMSRLYSLCGGELVGVMFGSVNQSIWESCKILLLPYLFWGLIELLTLSPSMRRFTAVKTLSLYLLGFCYMGTRLVFGADNNGFSAGVIAVLSVAAGFAASYILYRSKINFSSFFPQSVFLLFLFWAVYFSFTPFPPKSAVFLDPTTGLYGIIPSHIDVGAAVLDVMYAQI